MKINARNKYSLVQDAFGGLHSNSLAMSDKYVNLFDQKPIPVPRYQFNQIRPKSTNSFDGAKDNGEVSRASNLNASNEIEMGIIPKNMSQSTIKRDENAQLKFSESEIIVNPCRNQPQVNGGENMQVKVSENPIINELSGKQGLHDPINLNPTRKKSSFRNGLNFVKDGEFAAWVMNGKSDDFGQSEKFLFST